MDSLIFFINGCLKIRETSDEDELPLCHREYHIYNMRFLTESKTKQIIKIVIKDDHDNIIEHTQKIEGLTVISINCTPFMETYNYKSYTHRRLTYEVFVKKNFSNKKLYEGSFPVINPEHKDDLVFGAVSCNKNYFDKSTLSQLYTI